MFVSFITSVLQYALVFFKKKNYKVYISAKYCICTVTDLRKVGKSLEVNPSQRGQRSHDSGDNRF